MIDRRQFVAGAAALSAVPVAARGAPAGAFPKGFLWGASTAAHQVEGNNVNSDCWALENVEGTAFVERSGDAANSFELWPVDLDLVRGMGLNTYRFSLEWARIEPEPGVFSVAMLDHYKAMIDGCRARGIHPIVTFNHFTTPRWFAMRGGWINDDGPALFARYCDRAARHLAGGIGHATTLNEPNLAGVLDRVLPPPIGKTILDADRRTSEAAAKKFGVPLFIGGISVWLPDPAKARANLLRGHALGRQAIKAVRGDLPVGVTLAIIDDQGVPTKRDAMRDLLYLPWLEAARQDDFVGVQNYERAVWGVEGKLPVPAGVPTNAGGGEIYPASLAGAVRYAHSVANVPVIVTEHGIQTEDDTQRARFIPAALRALREAIAEGVPVQGYCHWSLIDNFEWGFGYKPKYGLHSFDRQTFRRTAKLSAKVLGRIAKANSL